MAEQPFRGQAALITGSSRGIGCAIVVRTDLRDQEAIAALAQQFGHLPQVGARIDYQGFEFEVTAADGRRIEQVRVRRAVAVSLEPDDG